ncbi:MAG: hypothetical protein O3A82_08210 [Verrucomicrobia bacterium]|nr:hypothetical protein [Verrucomicrobiota bacterium]MDA1046895.1 hypothetical protein [Verrucomicrobiota bacterium]
MLKIPTFVLGGLLIMTGLVGYLFQDPNLSINIVGPLADDAVFTLSDGNRTHTLDRGFASSNSAGEHAFWLIERLNQNHAKDRSQGNYAASERPDNPAYKAQSFWYASSTGDTLAALIENAETGNLISLDQVDANKSKVRFIYKKAVDGDGPVTLTSTNWMNVEGAPGAGEPLTFGKSWTALIPGIIALVLIACVLAAEAKPALRKHIMHLAATVGLVGLVMSAKKIIPAFSEMEWLKKDPNGIIHASSLKPVVMFFSAGLLFIFVVLCILSFINARREMAAQPKPKKEEKKKEDDFEDDDDEDEDDNDEDEDDKDSLKAKEKAKDDSDDKKKDAKSPAKPMGATPKKGEGKLKTSKSSESPLGEKKKFRSPGTPKSIDPEKAMRPKSSDGQRDGTPKPSEKAKPSKPRSGEPTRDEKPEAPKSSHPENSKPRESDKTSVAEADTEKNSEPTESGNSKPFEPRSGELKRDEKPEVEKSSDPEDSKPRKSDKAEVVEEDKGTSDSDAGDSKPDIASADEGKEDSGKREGDKQKESPESSKKKQD